MKHMKKLSCTISALAMCGTILTGVLPAGAAYDDPGEFTINLRALSGGYIPGNNPNKIYISPKEAENGTRLHFGVYAEAEHADLVIMTTHISSETEQITFDNATFQNPSSYAYSEAKDFTLPDGTTFSTRFQPYCFGNFNGMGVYTPNATGCLANISDSLLKFTWMANYQNTGTFQTNSAEFLGGISDYFSFIEFDVQVAPGTAPGTYPLNFVTNQEKTDSATSISSDASTPDPDNEGKVLTHYSDMIPTLKNAQIIIAETPPTLEAETSHCFRFAEDETPFTMQDFPSELSLTYGGDTLHIPSEQLLEFFTAGSPSEMEIDKPITLNSELSLSGTEVQNPDGTPAALTYHVGLKGDVNLDGEVNSRDAALVCQYAASKGSGQASSLTEQPGTETERFAYFLGDIDGESTEEGEDGSELNASDAGKILRYAAAVGSGETLTWDEIKS